MEHINYALKRKITIIYARFFDKRAKLQLSQSAMETLSIIAYNPRITRAEIEAIRGVSSDGVIYKLLDYNLIVETGKLDAPEDLLHFLQQMSF